MAENKNEIVVKTKSNKFKVIKRNRMTFGDRVFYLLDYLFFTVFTFTCIFPFYYIFINTISDIDKVNKGMVNFIPKGVTFQNYLDLMAVSDLGTALMVVATAFVGYLMTKDEMWNKKFFYRFLVITMYFNAGLIPWYMNMQMLGLTNHFAAYIIPSIVAPYNIILVKTYIESIPSELEESAFIDGASYMQVFRKVIWPLSKPILATIAIFGAVGNWNSFQDSLILMSNEPKLYTLQHRLYIYLTQTSNIGKVISSDKTAVKQAAASAKIIKYTISMVSIVPILLVYPFMQQYFEEGIMLGAVKG